MVDVVGDDGAATGHLVPHKLPRHIIGDGCPPVLPIAGQLFLQFGPAQVFAQGDIFHFGGDDAFSGIVHLADIHAGLGPQRFDAAAREGGHAGAAVWALQPIVFGLYRPAGIFLHIPSGGDPLVAARGKAGGNVDGDRRIGIGPGSVIQAHGRLIGRWLQHHFPHRYAEWPDMNLS